MIYGLYLSATGVLTNSYRQDVIANNLANSETVGFRRDLAVFQERLTEAKASGLSPARHSNPMLEALGGGHWLAPTVTDYTQGGVEATGNALDMAIDGEGFFAVRGRGQTFLTRDGRFTINSAGNLARVVGGEEVLDDRGQPIPLVAGRPITIDKDGTITQNGVPAGKIGVYDVPNRAMLRKQAGLLFSHPELDKNLRPGPGHLLGGAVEGSNVDPAQELVALMDAQRQLEANANMIRCQDQTLGRLVNDVAKIG